MSMSELAPAYRILYGIEARIYSRKGNGISGRITFEAISDNKLEASLVERLQMELGYHPAGYGGPWSIYPDTLANGKIRTTWQCSASCD